MTILQFYYSWLTPDCFPNIWQKSNVLVLIGSFRECFQASIVLGHPAAPVLPKSRFDISETHEDLAFDTQVCRKLKLKVKIYRLPSQKWWLSCIWWKQVISICWSRWLWLRKKWKVVLSRCEMTKTQLDPRSSIRACLCTEDFCNHDQTGKFCGCGEGDNYHHHLQSPVHQLDLKIFFPQQLHQIQNQESSALKSLSRWYEGEIALTTLLKNSGGNLCWLRWRLHGYRQLGRKH